MFGILRLFIHLCTGDMLRSNEIIFCTLLRDACLQVPQTCSIVTVSQLFQIPHTKLFHSPCLQVIYYNAVLLSNKQAKLKLLFVHVVLIFIIHSAVVTVIQSSFEWLAKKECSWCRLLNNCQNFFQHGESVVICISGGGGCLSLYSPTIYHTHASDCAVVIHCSPSIIYKNGQKYIQNLVMN